MRSLDDLMEAFRIEAIREQDQCGHLPYGEFIRCICAMDEETEDADGTAER